MNLRLKIVIVTLARVFALPWSLVPFALRRRIVSGLIFVESRIGTPKATLSRLFGIWDDLDLVINERATAYGDGVNPKHRLTRYHDFFVDRIARGSRILDVGCGVGAVARDIAERVPGCDVTGIDFDASMVARAGSGPLPDNLHFVLGDVIRDLADEHWDVIVLSNVLEHVEDRVGLLRGLVDCHTPARLLIRVPLFERHWHMPLRRELGVGYFSDPTHEIEHTLEEFDSEIAQAGLVMVERLTRWGEILAHCEPAP
jgi:SAM-dependent methyltransferase